MCVESVALLGLDDKFWEKKFFAGQIEPFYTHFTHFKKSEENQPILPPPPSAPSADVSTFFPSLNPSLTNLFQSEGPWWTKRMSSRESPPSSTPS